MPNHTLNAPRNICAGSSPFPNEMRLGSIANWALGRKNLGIGRPMEKKCQGCVTMKPLSEFYEVRGGRNRGIYRVRERDHHYLLGKCKTCRILQVRERQLLIRQDSEIA